MSAFDEPMRHHVHVHGSAIIAMYNGNVYEVTESYDWILEQLDEDFVEVHAIGNDDRVRRTSLRTHLIVQVSQA